MRKIVIFGATSAIAQAAARCFAADGDAFHLVARNAEKLSGVAADLNVRGASAITTRVDDLNDFSLHQSIIAEADHALSGIDIALIAHGTLSDQKKCEQDFEEARREIETNFLGPASLATHLANLFESRSAGVLAVITSVAGDRGRKKNYVYGSAKGAVNLFLGGLRNRLSSKGVSVVTIEPGFVSTPMTAHLEQTALFAAPAAVGRDIYRAILHRRDVVYTPWFWNPIMLAIKAIPETWFKKMDL